MLVPVLNGAAQLHSPLGLILPRLQLSFFSCSSALSLLCSPVFLVIFPPSWKQERRVKKSRIHPLQLLFLVQEGVTHNRPTANSCVIIFFLLLLLFFHLNGVHLHKHLVLGASPHSVVPSIVAPRWGCTWLLDGELSFCTHH